MNVLPSVVGDNVWQEPGVHLSVKLEAFQEQAVQILTDLLEERHVKRELHRHQWVDLGSPLEHLDRHDPRLDFRCAGLDTNVKNELGRLLTLLTPTTHVVRPPPRSDARAVTSVFGV